MRACEADRCDQGATVDGRWCPRHAPVQVVAYVESMTDSTMTIVRPESSAATIGSPRIVGSADFTPEVEHDDVGNPFVAPLVKDPPEYAPEAPSISVAEWLKVCGDIATAEHRLNEARRVRLDYLRALRESGMSLGDIAEVTGLTRQRIGQLLR